MNKLYMTNHFIERYNQRVLSKNIHLLSKKRIYSDIESRLTHFEKKSIELLLDNKGTIKIPLGTQFQMIIEDKTLITVY